MRVLHVLPGIPYGGMQRVVADLASEQVAQGLDVTVLVIYSSPFLEKSLLAAAVPLISIAPNGFDWRAPLDFLEALKGRRYDLVHLHAGLLWVNSSALVAKECPWVFHAHLYPSKIRGLRASILTRATFSLCDAIVGVSRSVSSEFEREVKGRKPTYTVYNGLPRSRGLEGHSKIFDQYAPHFGMATRFAGGKGVFEFIDVARELSTLIPGARFSLAGDGPLFTEAIQRVRNLGLEDSFSFPGFVTDIEAFWRSLDMAIFTSPQEAFGLALIEPMLRRVPVIAYKTGAGSDEVIPGDLDCIIAPYGKARDLAVCGSNLVCNSVLREHVVCECFEFASTRFTIRLMANGVREVYLSLL